MQDKEMLKEEGSEKEVVSKNFIEITSTKIQFFSNIINSKGTAILRMYYFFHLVNISFC